MSAHCDTCGADIVYPPGTWPVGTCQVCDQRKEIEVLRAALREIAEDYHCVVVEPDPDAGMHLEGCVGCFAVSALAAAVVSAEPTEPGEPT